MRFQDMIRAGLNRTGLTQQEASRHAGNNADWLKTLLRSEPVEPKGAAVSRLCRVLGIDAAAFGEALEEAFPPPREAEARRDLQILERARRLPPKQRAEIMRLLGIKP